MGYNIEETTGSATGGPDQWSMTLDLSDPLALTLTGDFDVVAGANTGGEATDGYTYSAISNPAFGTVIGDPDDGTFTFIVNRAAVLASGSDQTVSFVITGTSGTSVDDDTVTINILLCVARGTLIRTPEGERAVETLEVGDRVWTQDNGSQAIRWIGRRHVSPQELATRPNLRPVRLAASSMGPGRPTRDLLVSPNHRVVMREPEAELMWGEAEVLLPAKALTRRAGITEEAPKEGVEYFHLLFDQHEIIETNGLPTESFHPGSYSISALDEEVREELYALFPELIAEGAGRPLARPALRPWEGRLLAERSRTGAS